MTDRQLTVGRYERPTIAKAFYARTANLHLQARDKYIARMKQTFTHPHILDVGCGFGRNANWLAKKGVNVTAVNIDEKEIKIAREKAEKMEINISYFHANATELEFPANSFDVVLDLGCSHMIPDREGQKKSEAEMARVLKPSGRLIYFGFSKAHPSYISKKSSPKRTDTFPPNR